MTTKREAALKLAFENWLGSQGYDEDGMFGADEMEFAFGAGAEAWRDLAAQDARPAPGDALAKEILANANPDDFEIDDDATAIAYVRRLEVAYSEMAKLAREPQPAPELAAAVAESRRYREALHRAQETLDEGGTIGRRLSVTRSIINAALEGK